MTPTHVMRAAVAALAAAACASVASPTFLPAPIAELATDPASVHVAVDEARREVLVHAGPFDVPAVGDGHDHGDRTPLLTFDWPVDGWIRGFRISAYDADGRELPREVLHHLIAYNFDRRQLIHPGVERLFGIGRETSDVVLPKSAGVPLDAGSRIGFDASWHNETGRDLHGVVIRMALPYTAARPKGVRFEGFPFHVDVNYSIRGSNEFDVPPGRSVHVYEFVMPTGGKLIGIGGHLHEHGRELRLEDVEAGRLLFRLKGVHDEQGGLVGVEQKVFRRWLGLRAARLSLEAGRRYRLVAEYENPTDSTMPGAMAHIAGLFAPFDPAAWPALDPHDPDIQADIETLMRRPVTPHHH